MIETEQSNVANELCFFPIFLLSVMLEPHLEANALPSGPLDAESLCLQRKFTAPRPTQNQQLALTLQARMSRYSFVTRIISVHDDPSLNPWTFHAFVLPRLWTQTKIVYREQSMSLQCSLQSSATYSEWSWKTSFVAGGEIRYLPLALLFSLLTQRIKGP